MTRRQQRRRLEVLVMLATALALGGSARLAHAAEGEDKPKEDKPKEDKPKDAGPSKAAPEAKAEDGDAEAGEGETGEKAEGADKGEHKERHEEVGSVFVDLVLGFGKTTFVTQDSTTNGGAPQVGTYSRTDRVPTNVQSFILGGSLESIEHLGFGARLPITFASFNPNGAQSRSARGVGNLELEGEYGGPVARGLRLSAALGVALPTAQGTEIPDDLVNAPVPVDTTNYDRFSMAKAAAFARGYEDNALFEPNRLGLIPKVSLLWRLHGLSVEPSVKFENLVATSSSLATNYVGELVGAVRVGYWIHKEFELAARAWFNAGLAGSSDDKQTAAAVEPQVVLRFGPVRPYAGVVVPVAGPPNDASFVGVRLGVSAGF